MDTSTHNSSSKKFWIVIGVVAVLMAAGCLCGILIFGGALLFTNSSTISQPSDFSYVTPATSSLCEWQALEDLPRKVNTIAFDPIHPNIVYAGTGDFIEGGSGLYKSLDGGETWQLATNGLPNDIVVALALSQDASILYANVGTAGDIYASTDGAQSWNLAGINQALCCNVDRQMIVFPENHEKIAIVQPYADPNLSFSNDGGKTWQRLPGDRNELKPLVLALDPKDSQVLYLGSDGNGVFKSIDGGQTWTLSNKGMLDYRIQSIAISPDDSRVLYAGSYDGHLFTTTDGGQNWKDISSTLPLEEYQRNEIRNIFIDPQNPDTVYVILAMPDTLMRSKDGGQTWSRFATPPSDDLPAQSSTMAMNFEPYTQLIMGLLFNSGDNSGGWRCVP